MKLKTAIRLRAMSKAGKEKRLDELNQKLGITQPSKVIPFVQNVSPSRSWKLKFFPVVETNCNATETQFCTNAWLVPIVAQDGRTNPSSPPRASKLHEALTPGTPHPGPVVIIGKPPCCELRLLPLTTKITSPKEIGSTVTADASRFSLYELTTSVVPSPLALMAEPRYSKLPMVIDLVCGAFDFVCETAGETARSTNRTTAQTALMNICPHRLGD